MKTIDQILDENAKEILAAAIRINSLPGLCDWVRNQYDLPEENGSELYDGLLPFYRFVHTVDLNERGIYRCHVSDINGETIWNASTEDEDGEFWPVRDGFMRHVNDMEGLAEYLVGMHIIPDGSEIVNEN